MIPRVMLSQGLFVSVDLTCCCASVDVEGEGVVVVHVVELCSEDSVVGKKWESVEGARSMMVNSVTLDPASYYNSKLD